MTQHNITFEQNNRFKIDDTGVSRKKITRKSTLEYKLEPTLEHRTLTRAKTKCLENGKWLNDELVCYIMRTFENEKVHVLLTHHYAQLIGGKNGYNFECVKKWTKQVKLFECEKILIPVNLPGHWVLVEIDLKNHTITYYDSEKPKRRTSSDVIRNVRMDVIRNVRRWLSDEARSRKVSLNLEEWKSIIASNIPKQENDFDCGMFILKFAECLSEGKTFDFSQVDMPRERAKFVVQIMRAYLNSSIVRTYVCFSSLS